MHEGLAPNLLQVEQVQSNGAALIGVWLQDKVAQRLDDKTRGPSGPTEDPQEEGAGSDTTLQRTGRWVFRNLHNLCKFMRSTHVINVA